MPTTEQKAEMWDFIEPSNDDLNQCPDSVREYIENLEAVYDKFSKVEPMLRELVRARDEATPQEWYKIGLPWNNHTPYICAGHCDPHVGEAIIDVMEQDMFQETDDMTLEEVEQQHEAYQHANCDFICLAANTMTKIKEIIGE